MKRVDEGRHSEASRLVSRRMLWSHQGWPTVWLLVLVAACTLVFVKSAEVRQDFSCREAHDARIAAAKTLHRDASPEELRRRTGALPPGSC